MQLLMQVGKGYDLSLLFSPALANDYSGSNHMKMAAVIEFIHTATLLHDDVVDVASLRRGKAANIQWGNAPVF